MRISSEGALLAAAGLCLLFSACVEQMAKDGHLRPIAGRPPEGTVAQDSPTLSSPPRLTRALLERGRDEFDISCVPCHGPGGYGDGMVVQRGFLAPPSYHIERLRRASDRHIFDVITRGYGAMYSYADRVDEPARWAIVAYIRALQLSQHVKAARLPESDRRALPRKGER
jgi:mono/diheme cytochrome c family protein